MPSGKSITIDCPVEFSDKATPFGQFANAVRVTPEGVHECFLDFCVYSGDENQAQIVARVRVHRSFLDVLHGRLESELGIEKKKPISRDSKIVFLKSPQD